MRLLRTLKALTLLASLVVLPALAKPKVPDTAIPSDSNYYEHAQWNQECEGRVKAALAAQAAGNPVDILFIGDSITQNWTDPDWGGDRRGRRVWAEFYEKNSLNFGVGADKTQNALWRMDHMHIAKLHPKVAVIMIGTNNLKDTAPDIAAGVKAIIEKTKKFYPGIHIILVSILPNQRANDVMMQANDVIRTFDDGQTVYYLDLVPLFVREGGNWKGLGGDHLHPKETGYRMWAEAMEPLLTKLLQ